MTQDSIIRFGDAVLAEMEHLQAVADEIVARDSDAPSAIAFRAELASARDSWSRAVTMLVGLHARSEALAIVTGGPYREEE